MSDRDVTALPLDDGKIIRAFSAIPASQWEAWIQQGTLPFQSFSSRRSTQMALRNVLRATQRRMDAQAH